MPGNSKRRRLYNKGVCGKTEDVANLQDLLIYVMKGIAVYAEEAKEFGVQDERVGLLLPGAYSAQLLM